MTGNYWIEINGARALAECDLILYQRRIINGLELDFATWSRGVHTLEKREGEWRIRGSSIIYEKDRMDAVNPNELPEYPQQVRHHCWRNDIVGFPPAKNICIKGGEREREVRDEARRWIEDK